MASSLAQCWGHGRAPSPPSALPGETGRVRVQVLNGGGVPGVARDATRALRDRGFDVVLFGNAENFSQDSSVVIDRVGQLDNARSVADALGIREVRTEPDSALLVDVTVRLGPDWNVRGEGGGGGSDPPVWWDPRRLLRRDGVSRSTTATGR